MRLADSGVAESFSRSCRCSCRQAPRPWNLVDYTASRVLRRRQVLKDLPAREITSTLLFTLHDDNVGVLPQLATGSLHELTRDLCRHGWAGFSTRYWLIGDHEPCVAYLARAAWDRSAMPEDVYRDQVRAACGAASVEDMLAVFRAVETATVALEDHALGLTFPVPNMLLKHWRPVPFSGELAEDRRTYQRALEAAQRALAKAAPAGRPYVAYWVRPTRELGIGYLDTIEELRNFALGPSPTRIRPKPRALPRPRWPLSAAPSRPTPAWLVTNRTAARWRHWPSSPTGRSATRLPR